MGLFGNLFGRPQFANPDFGTMGPIDPGMSMPTMQQPSSMSGGGYTGQAQQQMQQPMGQMVQQPEPKTGFWDRFNRAGGIGDTLTSIGATLQDDPRVSQQMMAGINSRNDNQQALLLQQAKSMADLQRHQQERLFDNQNQGPTEAERVTQWYQNASPEARQAYDQTHPVFTNTPMGTQFIPRANIPAAGAANQLDATPTVEDGHRYTPGPGGRANQANWTALGGPTPPASGTFPRWR